ncbi:MAG: CoA pyrophosphatase [Pseudomonadota bacterium]
MGRSATSLTLFPADAEAPPLNALAARTGKLLPPDGSTSAKAPRVTEVAAHESAKDAAVLVAIGADHEGVPALLLTVRATHLSAHAGQVALPGGKIEAGETPAMAALREAAEEVALPEDAATVLGTAETYLTRTGFAVVPVIARIDRPVTLTANPGEVSSVFAVPLSELLERARWRRGRIVHRGMVHRYFETISQGHRIWGVTAGILRSVHYKLYGP